MKDDPWLKNRPDWMRRCFIKTTCGIDKPVKAIFSVGDSLHFGVAEAPNDIQIRQQEVAFGFKWTILKEGE